MVMFSYIWLEGLELKHINMSWTFDVQSDTRDCGPDLSRPFLIEKKTNRWCVHVLRIVDHGLFELFAGWGANLHTSHMSCVMYACTVCGGPLARGGART